MNTSVGIIGMGPAGLALAKEIEQAGISWAGYEAQSNIGGVWNSSKTTSDDEASHTYDSLTTNLPVGLMSFFDLPFQADLVGSGGFCTAERVGSYLNEYVKHYSLSYKTHLSHRVTSIKPLACNPKKFRVTSSHGDLLTTRDYDHVFVANGHFNKPNIPVIQGIESFDGKVLHSKGYRNPSDFLDKTTLIVGYGFSGQDIHQDLLKADIEVHVSARTLEEGPSENCHLEIDRIEGDKVTFVNGESIHGVDNIIFCTGYCYDYKFIQDDWISTTTKDLESYHFQIFPDKFDGHLGFLGLHRQVISFIVSEIQAKLVVGLIKKRLHSTIFVGHSTTPPKNAA